MSASDVWWFRFWESTATTGFVLVIIGCVIEGVEHFVKFKKGEAPKRRLIEKIGWFILIGGLAIEFLGEKRAKRIADRENTRLTKEAGDARQLADEANKEAALTRKETELIRSNETALKLELERTRASMRWRTLADPYGASLRLSKFKGASAVVSSEDEDSESKRLALQISVVLSNAGWKVSLNQPLPKLSIRDPITLPARSGVLVRTRMEVSLPREVHKEATNAIAASRALLEELNREGIGALERVALLETSGYDLDTISTGVVFVRVGLRPPP